MTESSADNSTCPYCGAAQCSNADWIADNMWECGSLANAGKPMQSFDCMCAEIVKLKTEIVNLNTEVNSLRKRLSLWRQWMGTSVESEIFRTLKVSYEDYDEALAFYDAVRAGEHKKEGT